MPSRWRGGNEGEGERERERVGREREEGKKNVTGYIFTSLSPQGSAAA